MGVSACCWNRNQEPASRAGSDFISQFIAICDLSKFKFFVCLHGDKIYAFIYAFLCMAIDSHKFSRKMRESIEIEKHNTIDQEGKPLDSTWRALFNVQN